MARKRERYLATPRQANGESMREDRKTAGPRTDPEARSPLDASDDLIEMESQESFPASDPPDWTVVRVGEPAHLKEAVTADELKLLLNSDQRADKEKAVQYLVGLLTSPDREMRDRGCELFKEGLNEALYQSCLNYRSLVGGFTHPLISVLTRSVETWSALVADRQQKRQDL